MELDVKPMKIEKENGVKLEQTEESHSINLYKTPPFGTLTIGECEDLFRQRLEALTIIEKADLHTGSATLPNSFREIKSYVYKTNCIIMQKNDKQQRRLDHFSHMLIRLYCVYNQSLYDWFKFCEKKLLFYRLKDQAQSLTGAQLEAMLRSYKFNFSRIGTVELKALRDENLVIWNRYDGDNTELFRVKFTDALRFIAKRSVSLKDGFAYLTRNDILSIVCDVFEKHLQNELSYAQQHLIVEQAETKQLLKSLDRVYADYKEKFEDERRKLNRQPNGEPRNALTIDINNLAEIEPKHFPPCIRYLHKALTDDHHLKHQGRLIYGTFLRSGGVAMEEAIEFWRKEFTKKIPLESFERNYKYNIRHLYGREGHKKALSCFSCDKIINDNPPGPSEKHGCPFKHFDDKNLNMMLKDHGLKDVDIESIFLQRKENNFKMACTQYFKFLKGDETSEPIKSPIGYYYESIRLMNMMKKEEEEKWDDDVVLE